MSWTKDNLSSMAKIVLFFYVMTSLFITISVNIVYFTPALGLFSILRHFQGELFPYYAVIDPYGMFALDDLAINSTSDLCYFSDVPPFPWSDLTRYNYTIRDRPTPPPISIYTYFELETCLYGFWIIWSLHIMLVWATKRFSNPKSHRNHNLIEAFTNAIENCQIPAPMFDWDDLPGTIADYIERQKNIDWELGLTMLANLLKNLFMMIPVWVFAFNVRARHEFLDNTIGYFEEELEAYYLTLALAVGFPFVISIATILQFVLYWLYNHKFHPFREMIETKFKGKVL